MDLTVTPAVHARRKSRWNPSAVGRAIAEGAYMASGCRSLMAVFHAGEVVGLIKGDGLGTAATFMPVEHVRWMGFPSYDAVNRAFKNGKANKVYYYKTVNTSATANLWTDTWPCAGAPGAGTYAGTAATARKFDNTTTGGLWISQKLPAGGETRHIAQWNTINIGISGALLRHIIIYDRVLSYDNCTITTSTTTNDNTLAAARYIGTGQEGLAVWATLITSIGATASTLSNYVVTDQTGTTGVSITPPFVLNWWTGSAIPSTTLPASVITPRDTTNNTTWTPFIPLAGGISGIRKLESFVSSANNTGTLCFVLGKPVGTMWNDSASVVNHVDLPRTMYALERVYDDACLSFLINAASTSAANMMGHITLAHG